MFDFEHYTAGNWVALGVVIFGVLYFISLYNNLVRLKRNIEEAFANIKVILKQRNSELPKLVDVVKQYVSHEKSIFDAINNARKQVSELSVDNKNIAALSQAENNLQGLVSRLFALAEDNPEIKSNENFLHMQARVSSLESEISDRREYYNNCVNNNNIGVEQFPDVVVAKLFGFKEQELLKFEGDELKV